MDKIPTRRRFLRAGAAVTAGLAAGCTSGQSSGGDNSGESSQTEAETETSSSSNTDTTTTSKSSDELSKTEVNVLLTYLPGMVYSPVIAADRLGYFEEVGIEANIEYSFGFNPLQVLTSDKFDIVVDNHVSTVLGKAQGVPVETVLTTVGNTPQTFASLSDRGIESLEDFPGHVLGLQNAPDVKAFKNEIFGNELSESQRNEIKEVFTGYSIQNLLTDKVDMMTLYPTNADYCSLEATGREFNTINMMDYLNVSGNAALTSRSLLQEHEDFLIEYTRAHAKGLNTVLDPSNKDRISEMSIQSLKDAGVEDVYIEGADPLEVQKLSFEKFLQFRPMPEWESNGVGWNNPEYIGNVQNLLASIGTINEVAKVDPTQLANNSLINEVYDDNGNLIWQ